MCGVKPEDSDTHADTPETPETPEDPESQRPKDPP